MNDQTVFVGIEGAIEREIADKKSTRRTIAQSYALAIKGMDNGQPIEWHRINNAILTRWTISGLEYIKRLAWSGKAFS